MHIDRYNYESFFLLYTDNELSAADRQAVERFVQQNPDLKAELDVLQQYILTPNPQVIFSNKEVLFKTPAGAPYINSGNCTTCFLLYADDELSNAEKAAVEQFVQHHPQYKKEFEGLCIAKLMPDAALAFGDKKRLYRHEKKSKPVIRWWQAAAILLLGAGGLWQWLYQPPAMQAVVVLKQATHPANSSNTQYTGNAQTQHAGDSVSTAPISLHEAVAAMLQPTKKRPATATPVNAAATHSNSIATAHNNLASHTQGMYPVGTASITHVIAANPADRLVASIRANAPATNGLTANRETMHTAADVNSGINYALLSADNDDKNILLANIPVQRKNALLVLFRKASRFIDRTTVSTSGEKQGIQIGNIEIALQ